MKTKYRIIKVWDGFMVQSKLPLLSIWYDNEYGHSRTLEGAHETLATFKAQDEPEKVVYAE